MFLIMGINQAEKKLNFDQLMICKHCGKYGHVEVIVRYTYFMLFFIPLIKWDRHYYVRTTCCGMLCEIEKELGKSIEKGNIHEINLDELSWQVNDNANKRCSSCGFLAQRGYQFCPQCGNRL